MELKTLTAICILAGTFGVSFFLLMTRPEFNVFGAVVTKQQMMDFSYDVLAEVAAESEGLLGGDNRKWKLHKLGGTAACLDGSPGGYWFSQGEGAGKDKFVIHFMGGGWCTSEKDCLSRATGSKYGSSKEWTDDVQCDERRRLGAADSDQPCHYDGGMHGLLDADPAINPMMYNWNKVYIGYCDGASFGGNVPLGTYVDGPDGKQKIYYRGKMILDSAFDSLLTDRNMKAASDVLVSGSSAGGLAVLQHIDYLNDKILQSSTKKDVNIAGVPDAGFFMDIPDATPDKVHRMEVNLGFKESFKFQNLKDSLNPQCISDFVRDGQEEDSWRCMLPQYFLKYIKTPLFIIQSFADAYQFVNVMGLSCTAGSCNSNDINFVNDFRSKMLNVMNRDLSEDSGYWVTDCQSHTLGEHNSFWNRITSDDMTMKTAVFGWYYETFGVLAKDGTKGLVTRQWRLSQGPWDEHGSPSC